MTPLRQFDLDRATGEPACQDSWRVVCPHCGLVHPANASIVDQVYQEFVTKCPGCGSYYKADIRFIPRFSTQLISREEARRWRAGSWLPISELKAVHQPRPR